MFDAFVLSFHGGFDVPKQKAHKPKKEIANSHTLIKIVSHGET
jgi:hypothetical protein